MKYADAIAYVRENLSRIDYVGLRRGQWAVLEFAGLPTQFDRQRLVRGEERRLQEADGTPIYMALCPQGIHMIDKTAPECRYCARGDHDEA